MARVFVIAAVVAALAAAAGVAALLLTRPAPAYDPSFDVSVAAPAYAQNGPLVIFDEGHRNLHLTTTGYRPFADLLRNDGYAVQVHAGAIDAAALAPATVLVINAPRGDNETEDGPAFSAAEQDAIVEWVRQGGSLLLITDHWPFGSSVADLSARFGVEISGGMAADPEHFEAGLGEAQIVYSRENGLLGDHPITSGKNASERVNRVLTFTGQSLAVPDGASAFLSLGPQAIDYPPGQPAIARDGGDVRISMTYLDAVSARGRAQGLAFTLSEGRVVMLGESGMFRAQRDGSNRVGMNYPGYDNRQLALNVMHWLTRLI
jgi:hypothetical protein